MPIYEYRCPANGRLIEVRHGMAERLLSWGELCARAGIAAEDTDSAAPVEKLISAGFIASAPASACEAPTCGGGGCGSGMCGGADY